MTYRYIQPLLSSPGHTNGLMDERSNHAAIRWNPQEMDAAGEMAEGRFISKVLNIINLYGRHDWIRTSDLFRVKVSRLSKSTTYKTPMAI